MKYQAEIENRKYEIELVDENHLLINGEKVWFNLQQGSKPEHFSLILGGKSHQLWIENGEIENTHSASSLRVHLHGFDYEVNVDDERSLRLKEFASLDTSTEAAGQVSAPMPGLVVKLLVEVGQQIKKGQGVVIVEAMKMENEIRSPVTGMVKDIRVDERQAVEKGEVLAVIVQDQS
jgi:pyruvate carboxylase subunit B